MNKRDLAIIDSYERSTKTDLYHAYDSFSKEKADAWDYCRKLQNEYSAKGLVGQLRILGANSWKFSAAFDYMDNNGNWYLMYITKGNDRLIRWEEHNE